MISGAASAAAIALYSAVGVPGLGALALFAALPVVALRPLAPRGEAWPAGVLALGGVTALFSYAHAVSFFAMQLAPGLLLAEAVRRGRGFVVGAAWFWGLLTLQLLVLLAAAGSELAAQLIEPVDELASPEFVAGLEAASWPPEQIEEWRERIALFRSALEVVYPAAYVALAGLLAVLNAGLLRALVRRAAPQLVPAGELTAIRLPLGVVAVFLASGAAVAVPELRPLAYNLLLIVALLFAIQGVSVVGCFVSRMRGPRLLRAAVVPLLVLVPLGLQVLALVGLLDHWTDFRRWARLPADGPGAPGPPRPDGRE